MTTLVCWVAYDQNKPASIYLASDSRLSWDSNNHWDNGRKIFFSKKYPDILGYCGDVLFCSQVISQVISYIDECNVFENIIDSKVRINIIKKTLVEALSEYPIIFSFGTFEILYVTREEKYNFKIYSLKWNKKDGWYDSEVEIPKINFSKPLRSSLLSAIGSGGNKYKAFYNLNYENSDIGGYSRSYFMCLDSFLNTGEDNYSGGVVQIAALYNNQVAKAHGLIKQNQKYLYGLKVEDVNLKNDVRWVNERFEICDVSTMLRKESAQIQPKICLGKKTQKQRRNFLPR